MGLRTGVDSAPPRVGLGCMGMSEFYGPTDDAESLAALHQAYELGYRHFDTADMYGAGHNERLFGRFLKELGGRKHELLVATKCGIRRTSGSTPTVEIDSSPAYVKQACEASLQRLGLERIDLYYLHRRNVQVPIEDTMGAMADLLAQGKIRAVGLSEVSVVSLRAACKVVTVSALQSEYSLWTRDVERDLLPACAELDVTFVAYSPLGRGFLSGEVTATPVDGKQDLRFHLPRFQPEHLAVNRALLAELATLASELSTTPAQLALAWVLAHGANVCVIPGARKAAHVAANFASRALSLSPAQRARLSASFLPSRVSGERYPAGLLHTVNV